jgi:hypothetical protein
MFQNHTSRRDALERVAWVLGGVLSPELTAGLLGQVLNIGQRYPVAGENMTLLAEIADVILPDTDSPGAKAAGVEQFIVRVLRDCHPYHEQAEFYRGLELLKLECQRRFSKPFGELGGPEKNEIVLHAARQQRDFFARIRQLTIAGYFQSEIGATKALDFVLIPGRFEGAVPMKQGQKSWAL